MIRDSTTTTSGGANPNNRRYALIGFLVSLLAGALLFALWVFMANRSGEVALPSVETAFVPSPQQIERGRYLSLAGNCAGCHSARGGAPYAGGLGIDTPYGTVVASNLTPDAEHGIGKWSASHFWRAMHNGRSKDGRLLYPAFPYPHFSRVTREDSDAIYAFLREEVAPSARPNDAHRLRYPYSTQAALAVWRAFSFRPEPFAIEPTQSAEWNRGAYLVQGLGHCIACHGARGALGATDEKGGLRGGTLAIDGWYAPSLLSPREAGLAHWNRQHIVELLRDGRTDKASVMGPMADVVYASTQHLNADDLGAMAAYLQKLPGGQETATLAPVSAPSRADARTLSRGQAIYDQQCAYCHGDKGQGQGDAFPPLAGNRAVLMESPRNLIQIVRQGGFLPATPGNPRPFGMPPSGHVLDDADIVAVLSFIRGSWGNEASPLVRQEMTRPQLRE